MRSKNSFAEVFGSFGLIILLHIVLKGFLLESDFLVEDDELCVGEVVCLSYIVP